MTNIRTFANGFGVGSHEAQAFLGMCRRKPISLARTLGGNTGVKADPGGRSVESFGEGLSSEGHISSGTECTFFIRM